MMNLRRITIFLLVTYILGWQVPKVKMHPQITNVDQEKDVAPKTDEPERMMTNSKQDHLQKRSYDFDDDMVALIDRLKLDNRQEFPLVANPADEDSSQITVNKKLH